MQSTALVQARVDSALKQSAETLFADLGLDIPTAIRLFLTQCVRRDGLPFEIARTQSATPNDRLARLLDGKTRVRLEADENGHAVVDEEKYPRLHDWAVNG